jgi:hypothetical protein
MELEVVWLLGDQEEGLMEVGGDGACRDGDDSGHTKIS